MALHPDRSAPFRNLAVLVAALAVVAGHRFWPSPGRLPESAPRPVPTVLTPIADTEPPTPIESSPLRVILPIDREAVAQAEAELGAARRERERAEIRAEAAAQTVRDEAIRAASAALARLNLPSTMRDPTARINRASTRAASLSQQLDRLKAEGDVIARTPRPKGKPLLDKTPVARVVEGDEFHFEVRRDRIAFFDLEKLMERIRADARVRLRVAGPGARRIGGKVGPVGFFSMDYEMARGDGGGDEFLDMRALSTYQLTGWELVPEGNLRGETFETAMTTSSEFSRAVNRLRPGKSTVTLWVYPDGFTLYRQIRDALNARGYLVAARPLPTGMAIRGSPGGSTSAGQ